MKAIITIILLTFIPFSCFAQQKKNIGNENKEDSSQNKEFNQKLADSLGADQYGMKNYMLIFLKTGPKDKKISDKEKRAELFKGHFANMQEMEKSGKLKLAGPFASKNSLEYRGIFLLDVKTEEEAKALLQNDPTIKAEIFSVEILPWYGSAAIPMHLKYHKKIAKENP